MNYVNNEEFLSAITEYQSINDDDGFWLDSYLSKLELKYKRKKIDKDKYDIGKDFHSFKTQQIKEKNERLKLLTPEENISRQKRIAVLKESLGATFLAISKGRISTPQFLKFTHYDRDEMVSNATFTMLRYVDRFDCRKTNPFSYFTQTAFHAFVAYINELNKYENVHKSIDYLENLDSIKESDNGL